MPNVAFQDGSRQSEGQPGQGPGDPSPGQHNRSTFSGWANGYCLSSLMIHHLLDGEIRRKGLSEVKRVPRPGGTLMIAEYKPPKKGPLSFPNSHPRQLDNIERIFYNKAGTNLRPEPYHLNTAPLAKCIPYQPDSFLFVFRNESILSYSFFRGLGQLRLLCSRNCPKIFILPLQLAEQAQEGAGDGLLDKAFTKRSTL